MRGHDTESTSEFQYRATGTPLVDGTRLPSHVSHPARSNTAEYQQAQTGIMRGVPHERWGTSRVGVMWFPPGCDLLLGGACVERPEESSGVDSCSSSDDVTAGD